MLYCVYDEARLKTKKAVNPYSPPTGERSGEGAAPAKAEKLSVLTELEQTVSFQSGTIRQHSKNKIRQAQGHEIRTVSAVSNYLINT